MCGLRHVLIDKGKSQHLAEPDVEEKQTRDGKRTTGISNLIIGSKRKEASVAFRRDPHLRGLQVNPEKKRMTGQLSSIIPLEIA
jgi:hypothetical protein